MQNINNMKFEDLDVYKLSMDLSDKTWKIVMNWDYFAKDSVGKQWVRADHSVSANISEGFGRNNFKINVIFITSRAVHFARVKCGWKNQNEENQLIKSPLTY